MSYSEKIDVLKKLSRKNKNLPTGIKKRITNLRPWDMPNLRNAENLHKTIWKDHRFWAIPESFMHVSIKGKYEGNYIVSTHLFWNQKFNELIKDRKNLFELADNLESDHGLNTLRQQQVERKEKIEIVNQRITQYLNSKVDHFIGSIENSYLGSVIENVENAELTFYGCCFGNKAAITELLTDFVDSSADFKNHIDTLFELNKSYLLHQIAIKYFDHDKPRKKWAYLDPIIEELKAPEHLSNERVREIFKEHYPDFSYKPKHGYFTNEGKPKKEPLAEGLKQIYEHQFPEESISTKRIKGYYKSVLESLFG